MLGMNIPSWLYSLMSMFFLFRSRDITEIKVVSKGENKGARGPRVRRHNQVKDPNCHPLTSPPDALNRVKST